MTFENRQKLIIYAPNIHLGGGLVLFQNLLSSKGLSLKLALLDERARQSLPIIDSTAVHYVRRSFFSRLWAEWYLWHESDNVDTVLCFHGLPPLLPVRGKVVVFLQNRILVARDSLAKYPISTRVRLFVERCLLRYFATRSEKYIVQTPSMATDAMVILGSSLNLVVCPFSAVSDNDVIKEGFQKRFDFVYVSSAEAHKNHQTLLQAWRLMAELGIKPSLALTLPEGSALSKEFGKAAAQHGLNITNVGTLRHEEVIGLYQSSGALIFPSTSESFGLPLIEAARYGLPILAPEMDYVRDVVDPAQTFDPHSPVSIARAVRRFLGCPESFVAIKTPEEFLSEVLR